LWFIASKGATIQIHHSNAHADPSSTLYFEIAFQSVVVQVSSMLLLILLLVPPLLLLLLLV
jgi:hypothetical protein